MDGARPRAAEDRRAAAHFLEPRLAQKKGEPGPPAEASPMADWSRIGEAIRLTMAAYMQANPTAAAQHGLTDKTFDAQAQKRIEDYVHWFYQGSSFANNDIAEEAARQCALGNPAACGETGRPR